MKLFYFKTNTYTVEACVMAENLEEAKKALMESANQKDLRDNPAAGVDGVVDGYYEHRAKQMINRTHGYTLEEHGQGSIIWTEVS